KAWDHISYSKFYLQSILQNFISNAIKYKRDDVASYIQFETALENKKKVLYVRDNGIGLNLDKHGENIFKLYKRFHRNISGKGMGLFLIKSQLEALNATITIESKVGQGTTFKIKF
ncbi:MAG: ATP-binding protein, partial [Maribacter sp.]